MIKDFRTNLQLVNFKSTRKKLQRLTKSSLRSLKCRSRTTWLRWTSNWTSSRNWSNKPKMHDVKRSARSKKNTKNATKKWYNCAKNLETSTNSRRLWCWRCATGTLKKPRSRSEPSFRFNKFSCYSSIRATCKCAIRKNSIHNKRVWKYFHSLLRDFHPLRVPI